MINIENTKFIVLEGLDGAGKATQAHLLQETLRQQGYLANVLSFPDYDAEISKPISMYLNGKFGEDPNQINPYFVSTLYAQDRFYALNNTYKKIIDRSDVIIFDRYTTSNAIYQCAKLPKEQWDEYLAWLFNFEYNKLGIFAPDLVIYLDVSIAMSQKMLAARYEGDISKKDIHEKNVDFLTKAYDVADHCMGKFGWSSVLCDWKDQMFSKEVIANNVWFEVKNNIKLNEIFSSPIDQETDKPF